MELLEEILTKENLNKAYKKVYQNKGASGIDGIIVNVNKKMYKILNLVMYNFVHY